MLLTIHENRGTKADGGRLDIRGVTIFGVEEGRITWGRLYMDRVAETGDGIDAAVKTIYGASGDKG